VIDQIPQRISIASSFSSCSDWARATGHHRISRRRFRVQSKIEPKGPSVAGARGLCYLRLILVTDSNFQDREQYSAEASTLQQEFINSLYLCSPLEVRLDLDGRLSIRMSGVFVGRLVVSLHKLIWIFPSRSRLPHRHPPPPRVSAFLCWGSPPCQPHCTQ